jgi:hypothetical protein
MAVKEQKQREGQLPDFVFEQERFLFDIVGKTMCFVMKRNGSRIPPSY